MKLLTVSEIAGRLRCSPEAVRLWITQGLRSSLGGRARLQAIRAGNQYLVRPRWLREFLDARTVNQPITRQPAPGDWDRDREQCRGKLRG